VGNRGTLFQFDDIEMITNVYVINGMNFVFVIDTYLGPSIMEKIDLYIKDQFGNKPIFVINTHHDWDHIWGNCYFKSSLIIGHNLCVKNIKETGLKTLEEFKKYIKGNVILTYPNVTFESKIKFEDEGIEIYHTPGHTNDSISIIDYHDKVLFAGDNVEEPKPYLNKENAEQYIKTLEEYLKLDVDIIIGGHTNVCNKSLIRKNIEYAQKLLNCE
jgi:glyoxylase-like metal-dependent hydrolase (beta-lactamase superfamily II)